MTVNEWTEPSNLIGKVKNGGPFSIGIYVKVKYSVPTSVPSHETPPEYSNLRLGKNSELDRLFLPLPIT